jgi:hypothetical protein
VIAVLLLAKLAAKMFGVWPVAAAFKLPRRERPYTTLLMATALRSAPSPRYLASPTA